MDEKFIKIALKEAKKALKTDDIPVGAVIVKDNKIISKSHNQKEKYKIATKHAEIIAIEKACKKLKTWYLNECTLYTTLEPCEMCAGAIIQSRIKKLVYSTQNERFGYIESLNQITKNDNIHIFEIEKGILQQESAELLRNFFKNKRN